MSLPAKRCGKCYHFGSYGKPLGRNVPRFYKWCPQLMEARHANMTACRDHYALHGIVVGYKPEE